MSDVVAIYVAFGLWLKGHVLVKKKLRPPGHRVADNSDRVQNGPAKIGFDR